MGCINEKNNNGEKTTKSYKLRFSGFIYIKYLILLQHSLRVVRCIGKIKKLYGVTL